MHSPGDWFVHFCSYNIYANSWLRKSLELCRSLFTILLNLVWVSSLHWNLFILFDFARPLEHRAWLCAKLIIIHSKLSLIGVRVGGTIFNLIVAPGNSSFKTFQSLKLWHAQHIPSLGILHSHPLSGVPTGRSSFVVNSVVQFSSIWNIDFEFFSIFMK